jgi:dsDNA-specific endonuclease/ATPase MutS2
MGSSVSMETPAKNTQEVPVIETISKQEEAKELSPFELKKKEYFEKAEPEFLGPSYMHLLKLDMKNLRDAISKFPHKAEILTEELNKIKNEYSLCDQVRTFMDAKKKYENERNEILKSVLEEEYKKQELLLDKMIEEECIEKPPNYE